MKYSALFLILLLASCQMNKSAHKDLVTGLQVTGDGISAENVYLTDGESELKRNDFTYGEKFYIYFEEVEGFTREDGYVSPGMELTVKNEEGETIIHDDDVYADEMNVTNDDPLALQANLLVADPIKSNREYVYEVRVWDKLGDGELTASLPLAVRPNEKIKVSKEGLRLDEVYLYSQESEAVIIDNAIGREETIYFVIEGLEGFKVIDGQLRLGLQLSAIDGDGDVIVNEEDLMGDDGYDPSKLKESLAPNLVFSEGEITNPVSCKVRLWDKQGPRELIITTDLLVQ